MKSIVNLSLIVIEFLFQINQIQSLSCIDEEGTSVDYFIGYKVPKLEKSNDDKIRTGVQYIYTTSKSTRSNWIISSFSINDSRSLLGATLRPILKHKLTPNINLIFYNDQKPTNRTRSTSTRAHAKGVLAFYGKSGFWLIHSIPKFPTPNSSYEYPTRSLNNGQMFICVTISSEDSETMENIAKHLNIMRPNFYAMNLTKSFVQKFPSFQNLNSMKKRSRNRQLITSIHSSNRIKFTTFSKSNRFNDDIYSKLMAPHFRENLLVQIWRNGAGEALNSVCQGIYKIMNVNSIKINNMIKWSNREDHSKWAISMDRNALVCISDINRMKSQFFRGGGAICIQSPNLWKMFKSIIHDVEGYGFKSYGKKVEISGFDPMFNSITGFNGSGKSNILDAICFVLGMSKMELARCHCLNDLIYKNGQAGVTTASVTIEIDNSDGKFIQPEYRNSSTIVVRREVNVKNQSKYYIDGFCVTQTKLLDFFQSVSLNIHNPHFLIMQGKINQVTGMKPIDLLSMIEESVGVSVYELKKKQNLIKIEKCDSSLKEINYIIEESIKPKLSQLKKEEKAYNEYRNITSQLEQMNKISIAYRYIKDKEIISSADTNIKSTSDFIEEKTQENFRLTKETEKISKRIEDIQKNLDKEMGNHLKELESQLNQKRINMQRSNANQKVKTDHLKEEQNELDKLKKMYNQDNENFNNKKKEYENFKTKFENLKKENETNKQMLQKAQEDFEAIALGLSRGIQGNEAATLTQQLMTTKDLLAEIESKINKSKLVIEHNKKELEVRNQKAESDKDLYDKHSRDIEIKTKEIKAFEEELKAIDFNEEQFEVTKNQINQMKKDSRFLEDKLNQLRSTVPGATFTCPYSDINPKNIIGVVCNLFVVNSSEFNVAIEKVCGGKLFHIVISDDEVGAQLIRKNLKERYTFLPLNKITGRDTDLKALRIAERLVGKGNVNYAINLVSFNPILKNAMKHVFGDTLVCPNMNMAKKVAFAEGVMKRTVTYDGEIFDPSGTLTGGALKSGPQILTTISDINCTQNELNRIVINLQQLEDSCLQMTSTSKFYYEKKSKYDLKIKEIELLKQRLQESYHYVLVKEIEELTKKINEENSNIEKCQEEKHSTLKRIKELEYKIDNSESTKERERKEAKENLDSRRKKLELSSKELLKEEQNFECLSQEIKHQEGIIQNLTEQITNLEKSIKKIEEEILQNNVIVEKLSKEFNELEKEYNQYKSALNEKSKEIIELQKNLDSSKNFINKNEREIKAKKFDLEKIQNSIKESKDRLKNLLNKYSWIKEEQQFFYMSDSEYGVLHENFNEEEFFSQLKSLKSKKDSISKTVNMKANIMQGEKQKEFDELLQKRDIALQDRAKLIKYIGKVEDKKDRELRKAWEKINMNFGSIFSTLLPNSNAKLVPVNNSLESGLEIKVAFGEVWKESLSELSGGQRSLLALSLVLALLKYNPAPLYILDEIDAALDQSHTQNIGLMIRKHFQNAQFIIVSLKDDMFSNANVLFQTKFIDGYSTVERIKRN